MAVEYTTELKAPVVLTDSFDRHLEYRVVGPRINLHYPHIGGESNGYAIQGSENKWTPTLHFLSDSHSPICRSPVPLPVD